MAVRRAHQPDMLACSGCDDFGCALKLAGYHCMIVAPRVHMGKRMIAKPMPSLYNPPRTIRMGGHMVSDYEEGGAGVVLVEEPKQRISCDGSGPIIEGQVSSWWMSRRALQAPPGSGNEGPQWTRSDAGPPGQPAMRCGQREHVCRGGVEESTACYSETVRPFHRMAPNTPCSAAPTT